MTSRRWSVGGPRQSAIITSNASFPLRRTYTCRKQRLNLGFLESGSMATPQLRKVCRMPTGHYRLLVPLCPGSGFCQMYDRSPWKFSPGGPSEIDIIWSIPSSLSSKMSDTQSKAERMVGSMDEPKATNGYHETEYADVQSAPGMTFKKLSALNALLMLSAMSMLPFFLIGGSLCNSPLEKFLILAFVAVDLNGPNSYTWLGMVYA